MAGRPTINDIARLAGVSKATVSRVLNHKPDVDPATRERVMRIVEEQSFVPSITATGLAGGQSRLIGALVPAFTWPFISDIMRGVAEVVGVTSYELVLYSISDRRRENDNSDILDHILATKLTSGLLAIMPGQPSKYVAQLHKYGLPAVIIDDQDKPGDIPWVGTDNQHGAYMGTKHLIELGHQRIAHIHGPYKYLCSHERYQGYCQAMQEAGLPLDPQLVFEGDFIQSAGRAAGHYFFSLPPEQRPTAIFASADLAAYGVMAVAEEYGVQIPRDVALVGFDGLDSSAHVRPALTTVQQPFYEMGRRATELLLSMLDKPHFTRRLPGTFAAQPTSISRAGNNHHQEPIRIHLATNLVIRESCGSPRQLSLSTSE
jgi:LacI family transcriptional regulator